MQKPAFIVEYGNVKVVIWENPTGKSVFYNVVPTKRYKNKEEKWQERSHFGFEDLLTLAKALIEAHSWINEQRREQCKNR